MKRKHNGVHGILLPGNKSKCPEILFFVLKITQSFDPVHNYVQLVYVVIEKKSLLDRIF